MYVCLSVCLSVSVTQDSIVSFSEMEFSVLSTLQNGKNLMKCQVYSKGIFAKFGYFSQYEISNVQLIVSKMVQLILLYHVQLLRYLIMNFTKNPVSTWSNTPKNYSVRNLYSACLC